MAAWIGGIVAVIVIILAAFAVKIYKDLPR